MGGKGGSRCLSGGGGKGKGHEEVENYDNIMPLGVLENETDPCLEPTSRETGGADKNLVGVTSA